MRSSRWPLLAALTLVGLRAAAADPPSDPPCPAETPFVFSLEAAGGASAPGGNALELYLAPGETRRLEVTAYLETNPPGQTVTVDLCGLLGMSVAHEKGLLGIEELDLTSTEAGQRFFVGGRTVETEAAAGFVAGFPLCFVPSPHTFTGRMSIARAAYALESPFGPEDLGKDIETSLRFEAIPEGGRPGLESYVTVGGQSATPCLRELEVTFRVRADSELIRADANFDGKVDVSDPVTVLRGLFHGDARIRCSDAADSNDDGKLDISDAVYSFAYLFLGGPEPPAPFPRPGPDPTPDGLRCNEP
ncbi:MAG: hypothetical protein HY721_05170 [Planctomycetes bacterium]|nr:hypothetical protein [Planctomycetota bacterium]